MQWLSAIAGETSAIGKKTPEHKPYGQDAGPEPITNWFDYCYQVARANADTHCGSLLQLQHQPACPHSPLPKEEKNLL